MQKQLSKPQNQGRDDPLGELCERLAASRRLVASDKPIFARNLGALAALVSPDDPLEGARRIVMHSGKESLWPTKRKKFFRLPGEPAPPAGKDGDYASSPVDFMKLSEAAGELLCKSNRPESRDESKKRAVKNLVSGSSFMPSFIATDISSQSAKSLLDDYAAVLSKAVKGGTKITELWKILQNTPIGLETLEEDEENCSAYGEAANFPRSLLTPMYRDFVTKGHLTTEARWKGDTLPCDDGWSKPTVEIGSLAFPVRIKMFSIPEEKAHLFAYEPKMGRLLPEEALDWLRSTGFDLAEMKFPDLSVGDETFGWKDAQAVFLVRVGLGITHYGDSEPNVEIQLWGDNHYVAHLSQQECPTLKENVEAITLNPGLTQTMELYVDETAEGLEVIYDQPFSPHGGPQAKAIGFLPSLWSVADGEGCEWTAPREAWLDKDLQRKLRVLREQGGWTDNKLIAELLLDRGVDFHPKIPESEPLGGVMPSGSVGASLLQNARYASQTNRITQILIEKVSLTANTGLRFYEAMVDDFRSAIHRI